MRKRICIVTATRAEYGLLVPLVRKLRSLDAFDVHLIVTGAHLSSEFGTTVDQIRRDEMPISKSIEMLLSSDSQVGASKSLGVATIGFADAFGELGPDLVIVLGDRYELLAPVSVALLQRIPVAHIHGGELTEGAIDDAVRHAITKLSHLHFVATEEYGRRVIQMGESPSSVYVVGALGLDNIRGLRLKSRDETLSLLELSADSPVFVVTYHPETLDDESVEHRFQVVLDALSGEHDSQFVLTSANADSGGRAVNHMAQEFVAAHPSRGRFVDNLGQVLYLSLLRISHAIVGNSSSGIIEAPAFGTPTVNIGDRQHGRTRAATVIDCPYDAEAIRSAVRSTLSFGPRSRIEDVQTPYGDGRASERIAEVLLHTDLRTLGRKKFLDVNVDFEPTNEWI